MNETKTIDVKGLEHSEKEKLVLDGIEKLEIKDALKIIFDFNPLPLVYMLRARGEFEISYEKEGPPEWVLNVKRVAVITDRKEKLRELLKALGSGDVSEQTRAKARELFQAVDAKTIGILEQELIREGVSRQEIRKSLCDIHLEVLKDSLVSRRIEAAAPHPVHTLMEEHKIILDALNTVEGIVERIKTKNSFEEMGADAALLRDAAHHLVEAESHHQREEDILFPMLEKHDIVEPPNIMREDHVEFRQRKKELYQAANNPEKYEFEDFKAKVIELGGYLAQELESHIFKEDNILYQIALQLLTDKEWDEVKKECDKIGYCCFTPEDVAGDDIVELDLRPMPVAERHDKIFEIWGGLKAGQSLRIINDHDPKPLWYQFEVEHKDEYGWEYEKQGPEDWIVRIARK